MNVTISKKIFDLYKKQHKNFDYAVNSALDNLDPDAFVTCFGAVKQFELAGEKCQIELGKDVSARILSDLEITSLDNKTAELLIWLGGILPEV